MTRLQKCIKGSTNYNCIWFMRQAGRYLPEFRQIRSKNQDFIKLCLNEKLASKITIQPLKRFDLDAAIIFSDILLVPYALNQKVIFKKDFGPLLGDFDKKKIDKITESEFIKKLEPVYSAIKLTKNSNELKNKDLIGFIGAPWTLLLYMLNKKSPQNTNIKLILKDRKIVEFILKKLEQFLKIHIENQIKNGASIIQIFDSWAGLLEKKDLPDLVYKPTLNLVNFIKEKGIPVICFPRGIKNYKEFVDTVMPSVISIDYDVDPKVISETIKIPVQGGLNPQSLIEDKKNLKEKTLKYLNIFKDKPYIFNLGHGVLPNTDPSTIDYLVKLVKDYK